MNNRCVVFDGTTFEIQEQNGYIKLLHGISGGYVFPYCDNIDAIFSQVLTTFTERERFVITKRFGLEDNESHTLDEIGEMLNVSRERVRRIEEKTLWKLRNSSWWRKLDRGLPISGKRIEYGSFGYHASFRNMLMAEIENLFDGNERYKTLFLDKILEKNNIEIKYVGSTDTCMTIEIIIHDEKTVYKYFELEDTEKIAKSVYDTIFGNVDDTLFSSRLSPALTYFLLSEGYIDIKKVVKEIDIIIDLLIKHKYIEYIEELLLLKGEVFPHKKYEGFNDEAIVLYIENNEIKTKKDFEDIEYTIELLEEGEWKEKMKAIQEVVYQHKDYFYEEIDYGK